MFWGRSKPPCHTTRYHCFYVKELLRVDSGWMDTYALLVTLIYVELSASPGRGTRT